jgi:hypothetical protein
MHALYAKSDKLAIRFTGLGFRHQTEANAWLSLLIPSHDFGWILDPHIVMEHIHYAVTAEDTLKRLEGIYKLKLSTIAKGLAVVNVHPSFASSHICRAEICASCEDNYKNDTALLDTLHLAHEYVDPDIYLERRKLTAPFHAPDGTNANIDTEAFVTYSKSDNFARSLALLTMISTLKSPANIDSPIFIPMELKYKNPKLFGEYLAKQNQFLNLHRNVAIVRLVPDMMDYKNYGDGELDFFQVFRTCPECTAVTLPAAHRTSENGTSLVMPQATQTFAEGLKTISSPFGTPFPSTAPLSQPSPHPSVSLRAEKQKVPLCPSLLG